MISTYPDAKMVRWVVGAALVLVSVLSAAWAADAPSPAEASTSTAAPESLETLAEQAFANRCAVCHGPGDLTPLPTQLKKLSPKEI